MANRKDIVHIPQRNVRPQITIYSGTSENTILTLYHVIQTSAIKTSGWQHTKISICINTHDWQITSDAFQLATFNSPPQAHLAVVSNLNKRRFEQLYNFIFQY